MNHSSVSSDEVAKQKATVLLVDDSPENLRLLGECLKSNYNIRVANSGAKGLQAVQISPRPDIILLDIMMPDLDGYQVLKRLKSDPNTAAIPVIFVTAMNDNEDERHGLELGAVDYITKPIKCAIVEARVKNHLELKLSRDRLSNQNHWLEKEVARRMRENEITRDLTVRALACLAEERDSETGRHIIRTQSYVAILAKYLYSTGNYDNELTPDRIEAIVRAAPLHDVGKVGISDAILLKPGRLTADEFDEMKKHSEIGAHALQKAIDIVMASVDVGSAQEASEAFDFLFMAKDIALGHHEKWNGSGYPQGLSGTDIPLSARLMAVADVYDALSSRRVYKDSMSMDQSAKIIIEGAGSHFDPAIVDAFIACQDQFNETAQRFADV